MDDLHLGYIKKVPEKKVSGSKIPAANENCLCLQSSIWNNSSRQSEAMGHSEPAPTSAPSTGCPLLLSCG